MRSHQMTTGQAGALIGTITGISGAIGILVGGLLIHRLGRNDPRWQVWIVAAATLFGPFVSIGVYAATDTTTTSILLWLFVPVAYVNIAPILSLILSLVQPRMRGLCCAIMLFRANIVERRSGWWRRKSLAF